MERLKNIEDLRGVLKEWSELSKYFKEFLSHVIDDLEQERFIPINDLQIFGEAFAMWLSKTNECGEMYGEIFHKPIPDTVSIIKANLDAEEKRIRDEHLFKQAEEFLQLATQEETLQKILQEHQAKLRKLIAKKSRDSKIKAAVEPYAKFSNALQETNFAEKFSITNELREVFGNDLIGWGIFGNKLTFVTSEIKSKEAPETTPAPAKISVDVKDFAKLLESKDAFLSEDVFDAWKDVLSVEKHERNKPFDDKNVKQGLNNSRIPKVLTEILSYISTYGFLSLNSFYPKGHNAAPKILPDALNYLLANGYLQKCTLEGYTSFYGFTRSLLDFLKTASAKKIIRQTSFCWGGLNSGFFIDVDIKCSLTLLICCRLCAFKSTSRNYPLYIDDQSFWATSEDSGKIDLFIGCFWCAAEDCDISIEEFIKLLKRCKPVAHVFIAGFEFEQVSKISDTFGEVLADLLPKDAEYYLYTFDEDAFYLRDTGEQIAAQEIFSLPSEDEKPELNEEDATEDSELLSTVKALLLSEKFYCATAYLKARSLYSTEAESLYRQLAFALDDPMLDERYSAATISTLLLSDAKPFNESLIISAALRAFFYNDLEFDYDIPALYETLKSFKLLRKNAELTQLIQLLKDFKIENKKGAAYFATQDTDNEHEELFKQMITASKAAYKKLAGKKDAGFFVLSKTLQDISNGLNGTFDRSERKYFYVQFLCGEKIILGEDYLPKLDFNISNGIRDGIAEQILAHADLELPSVEDRINQIFKEGGDDYGSAQMLDDYLKATTGKSFIALKKYDLKACITGVGKDIARQLEEFKGGLELAQIHGQFYDMPNDFKEQTLKIVENCYEYAKTSGNYGVFFRIKKFWENKIKQNAAKFAETLEEKLNQAVEAFKANVKDFNPKDLAESVETIKKLLAGGNLVSAQTLIAELSKGELYTESSDDDISLSRFIESYGEYYEQVHDIRKSLKTLPLKLSSDKNKYSKARDELIDNWLPNGMPDSDSGIDKLRERVWNLLELLGFDAYSIDFSNEIDNKALTFDVKLKKSFNMRDTQPIAAFGSEAMVDKSGFRVACLFGQFTQENLIDYFKKFDAGNTLIFLDFALKLPVRRELVRALKNDKTLGHIFAIVDRVVIMHLIKNCTTQIKKNQITKTLMSLIMPFSKCQPYIYDSPKLPPEMFIGREKEIEDIKNPNGANIVYGGRQLGKSALLKMACNELDGNNNQRAIHVEIRDMDYKAAALHTSRELSDLNFFGEPVETEDWEELTRKIKQRLLSDTPTRIKFFLLTLDEADKFIESCAEVHYNPIHALGRIQQTDHNGNRFKFVIAGLRNIVRFDKERIKGDNSILPLLKSLQIKPFDFKDAYKLLVVPLRCLGLRFADESLIFTIAETALYFPGMLQLFCENLLRTLFESNSGTENAPPYVITESHIKKVLADEKFIDNIKLKLDITLQLDEDNYYYIITQIMAYLYYVELKLDGYSPSEVLKCAKDFGLVKERLTDEVKIEALMIELCDLNILSKTNSGKYKFSRDRIFKYMGTQTEVDDKLTNLM